MRDDEMDGYFELLFGYRKPPRERWNQVFATVDPTAVWPYPNSDDRRYLDNGPQLVYGDYHASADEGAYSDRLSQWHGDAWQEAWLYARKRGDSSRTARAWGYALSYLHKRPCRVVRALAELNGAGWPIYFVSWVYTKGKAPTPLTPDEIARLTRLRDRG